MPKLGEEILPKKGNERFQGRAKPRGLWNWIQYTVTAVSKSKALLMGEIKGTSLNFGRRMRWYIDLETKKCC